MPLKVDGRKIKISTGMPEIKPMRTQPLPQPRNARKSGD